MLQVYYGNDVVAIRKAALVFVDSLVTNNSTLVHKVESETYSRGQVTAMIGSASLFGGVEVYLLDTPSDNPDFYTEVITVLADMAASSNHFIIIEGVLLAPEKKKFEKYAVNLTELKKAAVASFNPFSMADALSSRDKKSLWVLLQEAVRNGLPTEVIIGTLWWQLKSLRLAAVTSSAGEAGMKEFTYNKSKRALRNFKSGELESLSASLLRVYHDGHGGVRDTLEGLEEWVLRG